MALFALFLYINEMILPCFGNLFIFAHVDTAFFSPAT